MKARVRMPVTLTVDPVSLEGENLEHTARVFAGLLNSYWMLAQTELHADGVTGEAHVARVSFDWEGSARRKIEEKDRRGVERRLRKAVADATAVKLAPPPPAEPFRLRSFRFVVGYGKWLDFLKQGGVEVEPALRMRYADVLREPVQAGAWLVTVQRPIAWAKLLEQLHAVATEIVGSEFSYAAFRGEDVAARLRRLDARALAQLELDETGLPDDKGVMPAGAQLIYAVAPPPRLALTELVELGEPYVAQVPMAQALTSLVDGDKARRVLAFRKDEWQAYLDRYLMDDLAVGVLPFEVRRRASAGALASFLWEYAAKAYDHAQVLGRIVPLQRAGEDVLFALDRFAPGDAWATGAHGAVLVPIFDRQRIWQGAQASANAAWLSIDVDAIERALALEDGFWSAPRRKALIDTLSHWHESSNPLTVEGILDELDRRGTLARFFSVLADDAYDDLGDTRRRVIQLVLKTRYKDDRRFRVLADKFTEIVRRAVMQLTYEADTDGKPRNLLFVHSGRRVWPAGNSKDPAAGVLAEVESYFSEVKPVSRPKPETMQRLAEPTRRKVGDLMAAMMCKPGEQRTREELIQEAMSEASKELQPPLSEKDFERVKLRISFRLIRLERSQDGVEAIAYVEPVRRFGDEDWESYGPVKPMTVGQLDAEMQSIHVGHELAMLGTFMLAEAVIFGAVFVVASGGLVALLELTVAITVRELIYYFTTPEADRDIDGFLTAALYGVVDVLGFRLGSQLGAKLAGRFVTEAAIKSAATKWIIYATKGLVQSSALGATMVVEKFGDDLFHMSSCRRWSSPMDYLKEFGTGFAVGLVFEFAVGPALTLAARSAVRGMSKVVMGAKDVATELRKYLSPGEIEAALEQGANKLEGALANTLKAEKQGLAQQLMDALRKQLKEVVESAKAEPKGFFAKVDAEYTTRAMKATLEAANVELSGTASKMVQRLARVADGEQATQFLRLLADNRTIANETLEAFARAKKPPLEDFLTQFSKYSRYDQTFALRNAASRHPGDILAQASNLRRNLVAGAKDIAVTDAERTEQVAAGLHRGARKRVLAAFRDGQYQTALLDVNVAENAKAVAQMKSELRGFAPDAIFGVERGGPFVADAAAYGEPALMKRVVRIPDGKWDEVVAVLKERIRTMIRQEGKTRFAVTDVYFSGSTFDKLNNDVLRPLAKEFPECEFRGFWLRERLGFERLEATAEGTQARLPGVSVEDQPRNLVNRPIPVPLAVGDDAAVIVEGRAAEPVYVFGRDGTIQKMFTPRPGETTRDLVIRLLNEWRL